MDRYFGCRACIPGLLVFVHVHVGVYRRTSEKAKPSARRGAGDRRAWKEEELISEREQRVLGIGGIPKHICNVSWW